jgi:peptidoglycan/xylan/chitin deacetylase (PgdA/CDA1 family)
MITELALIAPLLILYYSGFVPWYIIITILITFYWIPKWIIKLLNKLYPDVVTHYSDYKNSNKQIVSLTFNNVPHTFESFAKILSLLDAYKMRATFFIISDYVTSENRNLLIEAVKNGHQLANHGKTNSMHLLCRHLSREIEECDQLIADIYLEAHIDLPNHMYYRPGCGLFNRRIINCANKFGYELALGSVYPNDPIFCIPYWNYLYLKWHIQTGDVVTLHDRKWTPKMLEYLLEYLQENKIHCVTLNQMFGNKKKLY